jgi:hypothetical protein
LVGKTEFAPSAAIRENSDQSGTLATVNWNQLRVVIRVGFPMSGLSRFSFHGGGMADVAALRGSVRTHTPHEWAVINFLPIALSGAEAKISADLSSR